MKYRRRTRFEVSDIAHGLWGMAIGAARTMKWKYGWSGGSSSTRLGRMARATRQAAGRDHVAEFREEDLCGIKSLQPATGVGAARIQIQGCFLRGARFQITPT